MQDWFRRRGGDNRPKGGENPPNVSPPDVPPTNVPPPDVPPPASSSVPEGAFTKCDKCKAILFTKDFLRELKVCSKCGHHHRLTAEERIAWTVDDGSFVERDLDFFTADPLGFPGYGAKLEQGNNTGRNDGLVTGTATINGNPCALGVIDFDWGRLAGTMGSVFGEKFVRLADHAIERRIPMVIFCASGGARMQEGLLGLMQMAKTSAAVAQLAEARVAYIVILTDPTTGGALASYASLGDVIYAEPGATVAFAGTRVAQQANTQQQKPPANYQKAEFQEEHGMLDRIVPRKELPLTLARTLAFFNPQPKPVPPSDARPSDTH